MKGSRFDFVKGIRPGKSVFDLSYQKLFSADMGYLYPIMVDEALPGDVFSIANRTVVRCMPMVAPVMHDINVYIHYWFVPNRLVWPATFTGTPPVMNDGWELFITTGPDGTASPTIPTWTPTDVTVESLWDYFGLPVGVTPDANHRPIALPLRAYNMIWNEYYRDQTLQDRRDEDEDSTVAQRCWGKDYFTSALESQQRGTAPAMPITGTLNVDASSAVGTSGTGRDMFVYDTPDTLGTSSGTYNTDLQNALEKQTVDVSGATTFDIADLRLSVAIQRFLELNNRSGVRYSEQLVAHFGAAPRDERLQRPEYITGFASPLIVSEVLQQSETNTTPQGTLCGHGIGIVNHNGGRYRVQEHGWIIGLLSIMPKSIYQQGINRQFLRRDVYDYYWPEFANLSEQAIERCEIYATAVESENETIFGYQGAYDEYRYKPSQVCGLMGTTFDYWTISRQFSSAPSLNSAFVTCDPRKDFLAAPTDPAFVVQCGNIVRAVRPMPIQADPGRMDHIYGE